MKPHSFFKILFRTLLGLIFFGLVLISALGGLLMQFSMNPTNRHHLESGVSPVEVIAVALFYFLVFVLINVLFYGPIIVAIYCAVKGGRERMVLGLVHTAMESQTPVPDVLQAQARSSWGPWYSTKLHRFAERLRLGDSMVAAQNAVGSVMRYDVAGLIDLGGDSKSTSLLLEQVSRGDQTRNRIQNETFIRVFYLCFYCLPALFWVVPWIFIWIIPKFEMIFKDFDTSLPATTLLVILFSKTFVYFPLFSFAIFFLLLFCPFLLLLMQAGIVNIRPWGTRWLTQRIDSSRFLRILSIGFDLKKPIADAIAIYRSAVPSLYLKAKADRIADRIQNGEDWVASLRRFDYITEGESGLLSAAVRAENVPFVLQQIVESKESRQTGANDLFSRILFVVFVLIFALFVGFVAVGCFMPLVELIRVLSS